MPAKLPTDKKLRKQFPVVTGVLDYFPDAIAAVAYVSYIGNEQHNPGQPLHWARGKSDDHEDCIGRHLLEKGGLDIDGTRHSAKRAWRALAALQLEIEEARKCGEPGICRADATAFQVSATFPGIGIDRDFEPTRFDNLPPDAGAHDQPEKVVFLS